MIGSAKSSGSIGDSSGSFGSSGSIGDSSWSFGSSGSSGSIGGSSDVCPTEELMSLSLGTAVPGEVETARYCIFTNANTENYDIGVVDVDSAYNYYPDLLGDFTIPFGGSVQTGFIINPGEPFSIQIVTNCRIHRFEALGLSTYP